MRRPVFLLLGFLEVTVALLLVLLSWLANTAEIPAVFTKAEQLSRQTSTQVRLVRRQVRMLQRPELEGLAERLQAQTRGATAALQNQQVDFDTLQTLSEALGDVATGLEGLACNWNPDQVGKVGDGLGEAAAFLEKIVPVTAKAAEDIDRATGSLREDGRRLTALMREAAPDLRAARAVYEGLAGFEEGLDRMKTAFRPERLEAMREGFRGMQTSLAAGAEQVERLSGYTYPVVKFNGIVPEVTQRAFWPEGETVAQGMRKAAEGITAAHQEMEQWVAELPRFQASLGESRKVVAGTREALGRALKQQEEVQSVVKTLPVRATVVAEQLPTVGGDLAAVLRGTGRVNEIAAALRQAQARVDSATASWPDLRLALNRSATLLRATRHQFEGILRNRAQYEAGQRQAVELGESFATLVPLLTDQFNNHLQEQDQALDQLGLSIDEVGDMLPTYGRVLGRLVQVGRLLCWLMAAIIGLHGAYLMLSARMGRRYSV